MNCGYNRDLIFKFINKFVNEQINHDIKDSKSSQQDNTSISKSKVMLLYPPYIQDTIVVPNQNDKNAR